MEEYVSDENYNNMPKNLTVQDRGFFVDGYGNFVFEAINHGKAESMQSTTEFNYPSAAS